MNSRMGTRTADTSCPCSARVRRGPHSVLSPPSNGTHSHAALRAGVGPSTTVPVMRGDEERVVAAYVSWLDRNGWTVSREVDFADVYAERGPDKPYAEAKGRTAAIGLDVDTLYGQMLRRMKDPGSAARYVVVLPTVGLRRPCVYPTGHASVCTLRSSRLTTLAKCIRATRRSWRV
jgi:hypothetical protein